MKQREAIRAVLKNRQGDPLPVMEHFYTLQGEGAWTGTPAYFIRLAGCDVGCHWCDVKESWWPKADEYYSLETMVGWVKATAAERVVITGGEPTVYDLGPITEALHAAGLKVHLETAGPHPFSGTFDWVCFSPKKFLAPREEFYQVADELKVIISNGTDLAWAEEQSARCRPEAVRLLQAEWSRRDRFYPELIDYVREHPHWRLSVQTHKYLEIP